jgi:hypothetical protein
MKLATSYEQKCCESNSKLWASGSEGIVRGTDDDPGRKRKLNFYSNIYVIDDTANPENNGRVFLFKYGKKILDKIKLAMQPTSKRKQAIDVFDMYNGADFNLILKKDGKYWNYDDSEFMSPSPLLDGDDDKLEELYNSLYDLTEFTDGGNFKSYEELKARLGIVLGNSPSRPSNFATEEDEEEDEDLSSSTSTFKSIAESDDEDEEDEEDSDLFAKFKKLAEES